MRILKNHKIWRLSFGLLAIMIYVVVLPKTTGGGVAVSTTPAATTAIRPQVVIRPTVVTKPQVATSSVAVPPTRSATTTTQVQPTRTTSLTRRHERFTPTEAYVQSPKLRELILSSFGSSFRVVYHMDIVSRMLAKEAEFRDTHWVFYHGTSNVWNLWQDVYTALFNHFNPSMAQDGDADFIYLRTRGKANITATDFLVGALKENGLVDDTTGEVKALLLSTNLFIWGNTGIPGESTWKYAMADKAHVLPERQNYESLMDEFGLSYQYVDQIMQLAELLQSKQQTLIQIFVPKDIVDDVGYLSWTRGIPAHQASIDWVKQSGIRGKGPQTGAVRAIGILKDKFENEKEKNPLYADMLETIEKGAYSIDDFLTKCCNDPLNVPNMDAVQARLIFTDDVILNPKSGVKMFRHTGIDPQVMQEYKSRLNNLIKQVVTTRK